MGFARIALLTVLVALHSSCCDADLATVSASAQQGPRGRMESLIASLSKTLLAVFTGSVLAVMALLMERGMTMAKPSKLPVDGRTADAEILSKPAVSAEKVQAATSPTKKIALRPPTLRRSPTSVSEASTAASSNSPKETPKSCSPLSALSKGLTEEQLVERQVKSILNKLTWEKFDTLYTQLLDHCQNENSGMRTTAIQVIASDLFKKATTQHNFIELYAEVCGKLESDLKAVDAEGNFRRLLLEQCQESFTKHLQPPEVNRELEYEEQYEELVKYKTKMIGNVRFIGNLLKKRMLAAKILFHCSDELMAIGSPEALETLCALLETVGPTFDKAGWAGQEKLQKFFEQIEMLSTASQQSSRVRCLLKDLLDKRAKSWKA